MRRSILICIILIATFIAWHPTEQVTADAPGQNSYQTPTPLPDGRILYTVQEKDSCLRIQLLTGITIEQLTTLNKLDAACTLSVGRELLLSIVTPAPSPTPNPNVTPTALLPTPTAIKGTGSVCFLLYDDINGDGFQTPNEALLAGGAISIAGGAVSETGLTTDDSANLLCKDVPEGDYTVSIAVPDGYNATTSTRLAIPVKAGNQGFVNFGAQVGKAVEINQPAAPAITPTGGTNNLILAVMGGLLVLLGAVLGVYVMFLRRQN